MDSNSVTAHMNLIRRYGMVSQKDYPRWVFPFVCGTVSLQQGSVSRNLQNIINHTSVLEQCFTC